MYVKTNVLRPAKGGAREAKDPNIVVVRVEDVLTIPARDSKGVKYDGPFVFISGEYAAKIYATSSSISGTKTGDGDEDNISITQAYSFAHPGDSLEINEFIQNHLNVPVMIFERIGTCGDPNAYYKVFGDCSSPLMLKTEFEGSNEATKNTLKFEAFTKSDKVPGFYYGTLTFDTVKAVIAADVATPDVTLGNGEYQLTDGSAAVVPITDLVNGSEGDVITLLGGVGGANAATIASGGNFLLYEAAGWTALANSAITFKAYKNGATASDLLWIEQSRS